MNIILQAKKKVLRETLGNNLLGKANPEKRSKVLCKIDEIDLENLTPKSLIQTQALLIQYLKSLKRNRMPDNMKEALKAMKEREIVSDPILEEYKVIKVNNFQVKCLLVTILSKILDRNSAKFFDKLVNKN